MEISALVYIILTIVTVALAMCVSNAKYINKNIYGVTAPGNQSFFERQQALNLVAELGIYLLLAGVSACRIAVGNDYWVYRFNFNLIAQNRHVSSELGFNYVVKWMNYIFGYDNYLPIFALFSIVTVFFFVKAFHDQAASYALTLFLFMTCGYYFNSLNSVRYYFVLAIALYSMKYVLRGEYLKFILWILFAALFHKSVILVIPVYIVCMLLAKTKLKIWHYILGAVSILSLFFGQNFYREIIFKIYPFYRDSAFDNGAISYVNILKCVGTLGLCALCYKEGLKEGVRGQINRFYMFLNICGLVIYSCGSFIPEVSRIGYYVIISQIFLVPSLIESISNKYKKRICILIVVVCFTMYFLVLIKQMYRMDIRLLPYRNWIFN